MNAICSLLTDVAVPESMRETLQAHRADLMLGSFAPDARVDAPDPRAATHFYRYTQAFTESPWKKMLNTHPELTTPKSEAHRVFIAGYIAHLAMDEVWSLDMLAPNFAYAYWGDSQAWRFFVLHLLLIHMDDRDLAALPVWVAEEVCQSKPDDWLPFMPQTVLTEWQHFIEAQIRPDGDSKTLEIFGSRIGRTPQELRQLVDDPEWMQNELWNFVPHHVLDSIERKMYQYARESLIAYMTMSGHTDASKITK